MKNTILWICGAAVLTLLLVEKHGMMDEMGENTDVQSAAEVIAETPVKISGAGEGSEMVKAAEFPVERETVIIDDEQVPLDAMPMELEDVKKTMSGAQNDPAAAVQDMQDAEKSRDTASTQNVSGTPGAQDTDKKQNGQDAAEGEAENLGSGIFGYYDEEASAALLSQINKMRTETSGVGALSAQLDEIAQKRALACVNDFSHNGMETNGECMAIGQADAAGVITSWYASDLHRSYVSDASYTQAGTACIRYDKGNGEMQTIWVLVLN